MTDILSNELIDKITKELMKAFDREGLEIRRKDDHFQTRGKECQHSWVARCETCGTEEELKETTPPEEKCPRTSDGGLCASCKPSATEDEVEKKLQEFIRWADFQSSSPLIIENYMAKLRELVRLSRKDRTE